MKNNKYNVYLSLFIVASIVWITNTSFAEGEIGQWKKIGELPVNSSSHQCFYTNRYVYCTGGYDSSNATTLDDVYYCEINEHQELSNWKVSQKLPLKLRYHQACNNNDYVYILGGDTTGNTNLTNRVWFANITKDGKIGDWQETEGLPSVTYGHYCLIHNGFVYCIGGNRGGQWVNENNLNNVWFSKIKENGFLSEWQSTTSLPVKVRFLKCCIVNNILYLGGGYYGNGDTYKGVWFTPFNEDGSIGKWQQTTSLPNKASNHNFFSKQNYIYYTFEDKTWYTEINEDATMVNWVPTTNLPDSQIRGWDYLTIGPFIYFFGGYTIENEKIADIYYAPLSLTPLPFSLPTHPNELKWYISESIDIKLSKTENQNNGFYYIINDKPETNITTSARWSKQEYFSLPADDIIGQGIYYIHLAFADRNGIPGKTIHQRFNHFIDPIIINSVSHPKQEDWYESKNLEITIANLTPGIKIRTNLDQNPNTIPDSTSELKDSSHFVIHLQSIGTFYLHVRPEDSQGSLGPANLTSHYRLNIYDTNEIKPQQLPVVESINVVPEKIERNDPISIRSTIFLE